MESISQLEKKNIPSHIIIYWKDSNLKKAVFNRIAHHLNVYANINIEVREWGEGQFVEKLENKNHTNLFLLEKNNNQKQLQDLTNIDFIDLEGQTNYYFSVFEILKKLLPYAKLEEIIAEFKVKYEIIEKNEVNNEPLNKDLLEKLSRRSKSLISSLASLNNDLLERLGKSLMIASDYLGITTQKSLSITSEDRIYTNSIKKVASKLTIWIGIFIFIGSFIGAYGWYNYWKEFSGEAALLIVKKHLGILTPNELYTLASLYEMKGNLQLKEEIYKILNEVEPDNSNIMFNLGIAFFQNKKYQNARACFEKVLANGTMGSNLYYWYGKSLSALGRDEEALEQHYQTLELDDNNLSNVLEILTILKKLKKPFEGLSLIAGYTDLYPYPNVEQELKPFKIMFMKTNSTGEKASFSIPEMNNQYSIPVKFPLSKDQVNYIVDTGATCMSIPLSLYKKGITNNKPTGRKVKVNGVGGSFTGDIVILEYIEIGMLKLNDVEAIICDECPHC